MAYEPSRNAGKEKYYQHDQWIKHCVSGDIPIEKNNCKKRTKGSDQTTTIIGNGIPAARFHEHRNDLAGDLAFGFENGSLDASKVFAAKTTVERHF
jgi:hypothetical protein